MNYVPSTMNSKKYILKPGKHQFAPGSHATHHNGNLTDTEAEWYLAKYPHIKSLFQEYPDNGIAQTADEIPSMESPIKSVKSKQKSVKSQQKSVKSNQNEDLSTTN